MKPNHTTDAITTALDIAGPLADNMDQAIGEATTVMGAMVTELMRRSLRGGVLKIGEQLEGYVADRVDLTLAERRPAIEQAAAAVAEQTASTTAAKVAGEEVFALEQRTTEAARSLAAQIEQADRTLSGRIEQGDQHVIEVTREATRELSGQIEQAEKRVASLTQAEIGQRVQELMDKAKEGATILKARIRKVAGATAELGQQLAGEREARRVEHAATRAEITERLDRLTRDLERGFEDLRRQNEKLSARVADLERPRGLGRLWAWLFRRGKRQEPESEA